MSTILVADDQLTARLLRDAGHKLVVVDEAQLGDAARVERPDLVVCGRPEAVKAAKSSGGFVPVLVVSSRIDPASRAAGLRAGAEDYLGKPYDADELRARVEALLRTKRAFDDLARRTLVGDSDLDQLTGLHNARWLTDRLDEEWARAERYQSPLAVLAVDLDEFGKLGAATADRLIVDCARILARACRQHDVVTRAGADEFVVILPNTHFAGTLTLAERVWREIKPTADVSVGAACYPSKDVASGRDLLRFAHAALARAKAEGRGKICVYQHQGYLFQPA